MQVPQGDTYYFKFTTRAFATGVPTTLAGTPVLSVYEENNLTQITSGVSITADYDGVTGLNEAAIVATSGNGYEVGKYYDVVITTGTVSSVSVVGEVVGQFRCMAAEGVVGVPDVNTTHVGDTAQTAGDIPALVTTVDTVVDRIEVDTQDLQTQVGTAGAGLTNLGASGNDWNTVVPDAAGVAPTTAEIADAVWDEPVAGHVGAGTFGKTDADILADTNDLQTNQGAWATATGFATEAKQDIIDTNVDQIEAAVITNAAGVDIAADIIAVKAETALIVADTNELQSDDVPALIAALQTDLDTLTDAYGEPTGVPAASATLLTKVGYLYMALRNQVDVTATKKTFYDDGGVAEWEKDLSDNGTTYTETEANAI
jgi:hypothetical protein